MDFVGDSEPTALTIVFSLKDLLEGLLLPCFGLSERSRGVL